MTESKSGYVTPAKRRLPAERRGLRRPVTITMPAGSWLFALIGALYTVVGAVLVVTDVIK